jgi:hypothetical protein
MITNVHYYFNKNFSVLDSVICLQICEILPYFQDISCDKYYQKYGKKIRNETGHRKCDSNITRT